MPRKLKLRIRCRRPSYLWVLLPVVVLAAGLLVFLSSGYKHAEAADPTSPAADSYRMQQYYLTVEHFNGMDARSACADGYHFASIWEILDPSNLKYNTGLGLMRDDSGSGPPTYLAHGWVRTGYDNHFSNTTGKANCDAWSSSSPTKIGTAAKLPGDWMAGDQNLHVWYTGTAACSVYFPVWCVQDYLAQEIYLPVLISN